MLTTNSTRLYERAFAFHDHGAKPFRLGVMDDGSLLGLNLRMNELVGAVALAQIRKLQKIVTMLRHKKRVFKDLLTQLGGLKFRVDNDPDGDCGTVLALLFDSRKRAEAIAEALGSKTLLQSGKHYYGNMIQLLNQNMPAAEGCPFRCPHFSTEITYSKGMLPRTDDILSRAVCLSIGVSDSYLGTDFGINVLDDDDAILQKANEFELRTAHLRTQTF